jgi:hypothetical protein
MEGSQKRSLMLLAPIMLYRSTLMKLLFSQAHIFIRRFISRKVIKSMQINLAPQKLHPSPVMLN